MNDLAPEERKVPAFQADHQYFDSSRLQWRGLRSGA